MWKCQKLLLVAKPGQKWVLNEKVFDTLEATAFLIGSHSLEILFRT